MSATTKAPAAPTVAAAEHAHIRKLSTLTAKPLPSIPVLSPEATAIQTVPKDAAMLELLPRGDIFAASKFAQAVEAGETVPTHLQEKLSLFEQSFSVLRFPHKAYQPIVLDPPAFEETFNVDNLVSMPSLSSNSSSNLNSGFTSASGAPIPVAAPASALVRSSKALDLLSRADDAQPTKLRSTVMAADLFESPDEIPLGRARSTGEQASHPPLPQGYTGPVSANHNPAASTAAASKTDEKGTPSVAAALAAAAPPSSAVAEPVLLRSYFPSYDWSNGAEASLCDRVPLPPPASRFNGPATRFLLQTKQLVLATALPPNGKEIEPLFCELALYSTAEGFKGKMSESFQVELSTQPVLNTLHAGRAAKAAAPGNAAAAAALAAAGPQPVTYSPFIPTGYSNSHAHSPCTRALFTLPTSAALSPSQRSGVAMVLLVYKVMQGKLESVLDFYAKGNDVREKDVKSAEAKAAEAMKRWGEHRQLLMWSACPVFNDAGALNSLDFSELYKPIKTEEGFTKESLIEAASSLLGRKKNPNGYKILPGAFNSSILPLPLLRAQALAELERIAPVFNSNFVPARMEEVAERGESICVGHEMIQTNMTANSAASTPTNAAAVSAAEEKTNALLQTPPRKSITAAGTTLTPGTHAREQSVHKLLDAATHSTTHGDPFATPSRPSSTLHAAETAASTANEEWVEIDQKGMLVRRTSSNTLPSSLDPTPANSPEKLNITIDAGSSLNAPLSPNSRALIQLDHTRQRSYALLPNAEKMSTTGFILEVDPIGDLTLNGLLGSTSSSDKSSGTASTSTASSTSSASGVSSPNLNAPASAATTAALTSLYDAAPEGSASPFQLSYKNQLFISPQSVTFSDVRNVCIMVQVKDTHESAIEPGLELIYPRADELLAGKNTNPAAASSSSNANLNGPPVGGFVRQTYLATTYHSHDAVFVEDVKVELPLILKPTHHLLFTFYNISCKDSIVASKDGSGDDRTLLGYAILPLYLDNRIVDESYLLPVVPKLRPHYLLSLSGLQKDEWENRKSSLFQVKLRINSTLYTNDPFLNRFFIKAVLPVLSRSAAANASNAASSAATSSDKKENNDEMLSMMLRRVLRSGTLKKKGLKWSEKWWTLNDANLLVHKSHREPKVLNHQSISQRTATVRSAVQREGDDAKFSWTVQASGAALPEASPVPETEPASAPVQSPPVMSPPSVHAASAVAAIATEEVPPVTSPSLNSVAGSPPSTMSTPSKSNNSLSVASPPLPHRGSTMASPPPMSLNASPVPTSTPSSTSTMPAASAGLDAELFESEMGLQADTEEEMYSWLKAFAHARIARFNSVESMRSIRETQGELLIQYLPSIMRQLLGVICCPDVAVDTSSLSAEGLTIERMKCAAFETLLEVASLVEQGTTASENKQRNVHLDSWVQYIFDDLASALPLGVSASNAAARNSVTSPTMAISVTSPPPASSGGSESESAGASTPSITVPSSPPPKAQRIRGFEAIATFWLSMLRGGGAFSSSASGFSVQGSSSGGSSLGSRSLSPLREYAARFSWLLLDMISKSLLLYTAGHRERRVSLLIGGNAPGTSGSISGVAGAASIFGASISPRPSVSGSTSSSPFFQSQSVKLIRDLVIALTQEIFYLSTMSLSLSKTLNRNLALFLRDCFYIFPRTIVFDWISLYLQSAFHLENARSSSSGSVSGHTHSHSASHHHSHSNSQSGNLAGLNTASSTPSSGGGSGSGSSSGASSRLKYTFLQIICDHEHYVAYNLRVSPFVGEAKKYLQTSEFGEWNMGDFNNQPFVEPSLTSSTSGSSNEDSKTEEKTTVIEESTSSRSGRSPSISTNASSSLDGGAMDQLSPMRSGNSIQSYPNSGHFLPFVLLKQIWLAFRNFPSSSIAGEQALSQSSYTLRSILVKHEMDARYQGAKKRSLVASMYTRLLPVLWNNLDRLEEMKGSSTNMASVPEAGSTPSSGSSNARKDLIACALYVLNNLSTAELLRVLKEGDYKLHPTNTANWFEKFMRLLGIILETTEYGGPPMRRLEAITSVGGVVSSFSTTLCSKMLTPVSAVNNNDAAFSDWGCAEDIGGGGGRLGALGGLAALENKYTRNRAATHLIGHRKSVIGGPGGGGVIGTIKRRDLQLNQSQAADRARSRLMNRTLNSKNLNSLISEGGSEQQFLALTGIDPALQKWEKLYAHESSVVVLSHLKHVALILGNDELRNQMKMQNRLLMFLQSKLLHLNQSDQVLVDWFALLSTLLSKHADLLWNLSNKKMDGFRCDVWWFELLRHLSFHSSETRRVAQSMIYEIFLSVFKYTGSTNRIQQALIQSFARVMDTLRNRRVEEGQSSGSIGGGWTILQADARSRDLGNDAVFVGVLSAMSKSASALATRAQTDPKRNDKHHAAVIQTIQQTFELLQKILETSAIIHNPKSGTMDSDLLLEHCHAMSRYYKLSPRMRLMYMKHMYDIHCQHGNIAEAAKIQLKCFRVIHKHMHAQEAQLRDFEQHKIDVQNIKVVQPGQATNAVTMTLQQSFEAMELQKLVRSSLDASSALFNAEHAIACLKKASELFETSELYEQAIQCENFIIAFFIMRKSPQSVIPHSKRLVTLWEKLSSLATLGDTRSFGTFYRVGFYGKMFSLYNLENREFIYREPNLTKLPEITSRLVGMWSSILGREVGVFKDSANVDIASLGDNCKLQVTAVLPYFPSEVDDEPLLHTTTHFSLVHPPACFPLPTNTSPRENMYEKNTNLQHFYYDTPYTLSGKSHGSVETQYKKRTMISMHNREFFPSFLRRLPIAARKEIELTPLQCVLEDVHKRIHKLLVEANPPLGNPDLKTLTQVLSGSVNVQVNGGSSEVCAVFLSPENRSKWDASELDQLREAMVKFVRASGEAMNVAVRLANETSENKAFIEILQQGYAALVNLVRNAVPEIPI